MTLTANNNNNSSNCDDDDNSNDSNDNNDDNDANDNDDDRVSELLPYGKTNLFQIITKCWTHCASPYTLFEKNKHCQMFLF